MYETSKIEYYTKIGLSCLWTFPILPRNRLTFHLGKNVAVVGSEIQNAKNYLLGVDFNLKKLSGSEQSYRC